jgi:hypothetical protein
MTAEDTVSNEEAEFDPQKYRPHCSSDGEKLRLVGATREEISRWFGVHEVFLDIWAEKHDEFAKALRTEPNTTLRIIEDFGLMNWLKDYRYGNLDT